METMKQVAIRISDIVDEFHKVYGSIDVTEMALASSTIKESSSADKNLWCAMFVLEHAISDLENLERELFSSIGIPLD